MRKPPNSFVRALESMDPNLSLRWSSLLEGWIIDAKSYIPVSEIAYLTKRLARMERFAANPNHPQQKQAAKLAQSISEELLSAKDGKRIVCVAKVLSRSIFDAVARADVKRYGGYSRMADELERQEFAEYERSEKIMSDKRNDLNREVYDQLNFVWRRRETALLAGERDMTKLLHGERTAKKKKNTAKDAKLVLANA